MSIGNKGIKLTDLVDLAYLQQVQDGFAAAFTCGAVKGLCFAATDRFSATPGKDQIRGAFTDPFFKYRPDGFRDAIRFILGAVPCGGKNRERS